MLLGAEIVGSVYDFCWETRDIWHFIGMVLFIFKIAIPILLIVFGMLDLGKAVVASDDKEIKNATTKLAKRAVAGVVIFFIPTLVGAIFSLVAGWGEVKDTYDLCKNCIVNPTNDKTCRNAAQPSASKKPAQNNGNTDKTENTENNTNGN